jgi:hypothetical protein
MAGLASAVVFALIDPLDVSIFGYIRPEREILYAFGFFFFWLITTLSSVMAVFMLPQSNKDQNGTHF